MIRLALAITLAALMFAAGWLAQGWRKDAEIGRLQVEQQRQRAAALNEALTRLTAARARGDALETRLAEAEATRKTTQETLAREINRLTTGRACLDAAAVRLLNAPAGHAPGVARLSAPAGGAAATDRAAASDTDVALWAARARGRYDKCRGRLDALIDWHALTPGPQVGESGKQSDE